MKIILKIQRFNPETDEKPGYQNYTVDVELTDHILDALMHIKRFQDGTLSFRKSCAHGVCGSDAMRINGKDCLACKTLVQDVAETEGEIVVIEPLRYFPVQRDLIVDQTMFFEKYRSIKPFLINDEPVDEKERIQSQEERMAFDDTTNCILCSACFSACPVLEKTPGFLGPAAIVQSYRFLADSRDRGFEERLPVLDTPNGIWPCRNHFQCTQACPRRIKITRRINQTKNMINKYHEIP
ncbi:MAG: succinate dehydrogenase iron-sulfur subunit [Deltaproteobacteria bacterium]|nr:succinate dehydrogenase iron-sulfur subunit [Deltaproteobacteria bacterium]MBW2218145.1 succinate dehydrogenase iron-sulfur subunit [Deltaproteobacteria bacterium]